MKDVIFVGNIDFVKILAVKYGWNTPIGEIITREEKQNEPKFERTIPCNRQERHSSTRD